MNDYIINLPQLQSVYKRIGALVVWVLCWLMWVYLLIPLLTLSGWLLGDNSLSNEMRWFGGYKSLLELLTIYFDTLIVLVLLWLVWVIYHFQRDRDQRSVAVTVVDEADLCAFFKVKRSELALCRKASQVTVYFDEQGQIQALQADAGVTEQACPADKPLQD